MMRDNVFLVSLIVALAAGIAIARDLPEFIHVCNRNQPDIDECVISSIETLKPHLKTGEPAYYIPSLEPLLLEELVAAEGTGIRVTARDIHVYGASDFTVDRMRVDLDNMRFAVDVKLPNIFINGFYEMDGKVLLLPIRGSGPISGNFTNCMGAVKLQAIQQKGDDGQDYMHITDFKMKIAVGKGTLRLDNLFGGEAVLGEVINQAINSNFDAFLKELQPLVESALSEAFLDIANSILSQFTFQQLFPVA
ncbi:hypothetical protein KM043_017708 [Ampulex compressa]|uniref:Haemolymph juvenile hormone binding protein n=1 Tax=Ampulex compressa TaxID=860918 RepID=A0A1W6EVZ5_AMPCP|nr:haemolymph juvenile hormone binding protein [Ampulex compressa]KAG7200231.1 hypothetical protein KM043_017708 [Ampulex compressa]